MKFKTKLILIIIAIIIVTGGFISYLTIKAQYKIHSKNYKEYTDLRLEATRFGIEFSLTENNYESINEILKWSREGNKTVISIVTFKEEDGGEEIAQVFPETEVDLEYLYSQLLEFDIEPDTVYTSASWETDEIKGRLILGFSTNEIKDSIREDDIANIFTISILVIIAIIISTLLANSIIKPIDELKNVAEEIGKGNEDIKANVNSGSSDMRVLALSFNEMLEKLKRIQKARISELSEYNNSLEDKNEQILSSIRYARTIQNAILPSFDNPKFDEIEYFVLYNPKDIVSGDFFWIEKVKNKIIIVVADCTGHGVPGAMISMLGNSLLNDIILRDNIFNPQLKLEKLDTGIINSLGQKDVDSFSSDGMDLGIIVFDTDLAEMEFSGAYRPIYASDGTEFYEHKGNKFHIGGLSRREKVFTSESVTLDKNCTYYLTSDGFVDQLGKNGKKFGTKRFKEIIPDLAKSDISKQKNNLNDILEDHQGTELQRDDITVLGFKII